MKLYLTIIFSFVFSCFTAYSQDACAKKIEPRIRLVGDSWAHFPAIYQAYDSALLTDKVLYADVWERPGLSKRDRSLVTVSALIAMNRPDQLRSHLGLASKNGLTREELAEAITHLAFYSGWPSSVTAATIAKEVLPPTK